MADTLTNPYLQMGIMNMMKPNPYLNPKYAGQPLPIPGFYTGDAGNMGPTDAMGQVIPSFTQANNTAQSQYQQQLAAFNAANPGGGSTPGTTLNSSPSQANPNAALQNYITGQQLALQGSPSSLNQGGFGAGNNVMGGTAAALMQNNALNLDQLNRMPAQTPAAAAPTPPSPPDLRQAYLDALAAPQGIGNNMPTPGAQGTQSPPPQLGQPSVLDSFLANNSAGGKAVAGNYSNAPFFNTLNRLNSGGGGALAQNQQSQGPSLGMPPMAAPSMGMPSAGMPTNRNLIGVG